MRKRRHRRRHKCTILNHHSFVRSFVRSLARQRSLTAHHWEGKGHRRHRRLHERATLNRHSFARSLIRSLASALSRLTSGEGRVSTRGAVLNQRLLPARSLAKFTAILITVRSLVRQLTSHARHWGEGDKTRPPSLARLLADSRLDTGE